MQCCSCSWCCHGTCLPLTAHFCCVGTAQCSVCQSHFRLSLYNKSHGCEAPVSGTQASKAAARDVSYASELTVHMLQACLHPCPEERLTCAQLLQLPYFHGIEASLPADFRSARVRCSLRLVQQLSSPGSLCDQLHGVLPEMQCLQLALRCADISASQHSVCSAAAPSCLTMRHDDVHRPCMCVMLTFLTSAWCRPRPRRRQPRAPRSSPRACSSARCVPFNDLLVLCLSLSSHANCTTVQAAHVAVEPDTGAALCCMVLGLSASWHSERPASTWSQLTALTAQVSDFEACESAEDSDCLLEPLRSQPT